MVSANRLELLQIADAVAREKLIDRELVLEAMEDSLGKAARSRYGAEYDIRAFIDRKSGEIKMSRALEVVDEVENHFTEISVEEARLKNPEAEVGTFITEPLPPMDFGRIAAQTAKQVIVQKVRDAERERQFEEFKDRVGEIINGIVKRVEYGNVIVDLGRGEGIIRRDQLIPREAYRVGDRIRAYVRDVRREARGPQIFLSRTAPEFMAKLFAMEVPEIYDGIIEIKAVARDPGSRAKIGVISYDNSIDPVGACVGMRGSRVQAVVNELQGEKIDIIPWNQDAATFIVNALQPAEVTKVVMDEDAQRIEVVVPDEQLSQAIGRRGQNVRLASQLTGWDIDIMTEAEESERRQQEFNERTAMFMETLNVDEMVAQLLVSEGFTSLEEVAYVELEELTVIDGFDEDTAEELQARARESLEEANQKALEEARGLGAEDALIEFEGLTPQMVLALAKEGITDLGEFAKCADWELAGGYTTIDGKRVKDDGILERFDVSLEEAQYLVMKARVELGIVDPADLEPAEVEVEEGAEEAPAPVSEADALFGGEGATTR
ncbi:transcription termination/antitermination protein NusA [Limibaculum sp. M0105]|uniref:Transcription termination/antitermination protein NusA n=1 Tax=Thermohalobaculum xanthum TaxID=2753746 RepID=A0A8J7SI07_9RHOB|nr:transcription termination factor NusA [Thermohalobaculum xanthum]MBK0401097.1 transcription termination/antitermination protein NusA [Thermohalobaculum xanthum]